MEPIKINEDFSILRYKYGWELLHYTDGKDKSDEPIRVCRKTFHADITQCCREILDREIGKCETLADITKYLKNAVSELTGDVEGKL